MPRIPVRIEPYSNPQRKQRHFKSKRDQILRALGKSSYINGSHFAILWVNARGETEHYASDLFQAKLDFWFTPELMAEAREMVAASADQQMKTDSSASQMMDQDDEDDDQLVEDEDLNDIDPENQTVGGSLMTWNTNMDLVSDTKKRPQSGLRDFLGNEVSVLVKGRSHAPELRRTYSMPNPQHVRAQSASEISAGKTLSATDKRPPALELASVHEEAKLGFPQGPPDSSNPEYKALTIGDTDEVTSFLETRFRQLQQLVCKIVAKAWIKVIEPKKQTRYPYNKGEECKPHWWPSSVRHKEPDHLMKPERIALLMTMLRSGVVLTNRLELATAEVAAFIPTDKTNLLREIYRVAREEERYRANEIPGDTRVFVAATSVFSLTMDDLNSPTTAGMQMSGNAIPRSSSISDVGHMILQRRTSQNTPRFDHPDPFTENNDLQQGYSMMPPQSFYYTSPEAAFASQNAAVINATHAALAPHQFQHNQHPQMYMAQQGQARHHNSHTVEPVSQARFAAQSAWAPNLEQSWPQNSATAQQQQQQQDLNDQMQGATQHIAAAAQVSYYQQQGMPNLETPAKQNQQGNVRSSPYLPTPLRPDSNFSASRGQPIHFSDFLNSPRTGGPGPLHEDDSGHAMNVEYH